MDVRKEQYLIRVEDIQLHYILILVMFESKLYLQYIVNMYDWVYVYVFVEAKQILNEMWASSYLIAAVLEKRLWKPLLSQTEKVSLCRKTMYLIIVYGYISQL